MSRRAFMNPRSYSGAALSIAALQREFHSDVDHSMKVIAPEDRVRPGDDLSLMQKLAMLQMMNSTLARGVAKRLASNEGVQARPSLADYCELCRRGLCERLTQYHELTFEGSKQAKALLQRLCADLDVHMIQIEQITGEGRDRRTFYRCSCGQWSRHLQGVGGITDARARNQFHEHWNPEARGIER